MKKVVFLVTLIILFGPTSLYELRGVKADFSAIEVTNSYELADKAAIDGDIISTTERGLVLSKVVNDTQLFGVVAINPLVAFRPEASPSAELPISRNGVANVNVTILSGPIKKGDLITSSEIPGKGQKANSSGYVIGSALEAFDGKSGSAVNLNGKKYNVGKIAVAMRIEYADINSPRTFKRFFDMLGAGFFSSVQNPDKFGLLIRYIAAGLAILVALLIAFLTFSRSIPKAIEAIGRNPLAKASIYLSLVVSAIVMLIVIGLGILAAFVVLKI